MRNINFLIISVLFLLVSACGSKEKPQLKGIGGKLYGGEFKFMSAEKVENLFPISTDDVYSKRLNSQIFESLLKLDIETMKVVPSIAASYSISDDAKVFTFKLRKGIKFHEDACFKKGSRELTAEDVKYTLEFACSGLKNNRMSSFLINRIQGAKEFFFKSTNSLPEKGVSGIKIIDDYTIEIKLIEPFIGFDKILTHTNLGIFPREALEKYAEDINKHPVGTGPFILDKMDANGIILKRNPSYWRKDEFGNQLPFLDKVIMTYVKNKKSELLAFRNKEIDIVLEIPVDDIDNILGSLRDAQDGKNVKHKVESTTSMSVNYVAFACESEEFKNADVRLAFNMAINRNEIVDKWLLGEGWAAENGFVPKMENFNNEKIKGHKFDVKEAQRLLAKAGFPDGKGFPILDFYVNAVEGSASHKMCMGIANQIKKNLNIDLKIKLCTIDEREKAMASGKAKIWRAGWVADYPDPENFLSLFYGGNINDNSGVANAFRFRNDAYNALFDKALRELDENKRNDLLVKCDQMIINEAAVMPIMTDDFMVMVNARARDFKTNSMENLDFSVIYIKEPRN